MNDFLHTCKLATFNTAKSPLLEQELNPIIPTNDDIEAFFELLDSLLSKTEDRFVMITNCSIVQWKSLRLILKFFKQVRQLNCKYKTKHAKIYIYGLKPRGYWIVPALNLISSSKVECVYVKTKLDAIDSASLEMKIPFYD